MLVVGCTIVAPLSHDGQPVGDASQAALRILTPPLEGGACGMRLGVGRQGR